MSDHRDSEMVEVLLDNRDFVLASLLAVGDDDPDFVDELQALNENLRGCGVHSIVLLTEDSEDEDEDEDEDDGYGPVVDDFD